MAEESLYDRSAWGYVFERVCHVDSPYSANQRLVLLTLAKHMGPSQDGRRVCFVNYRTLERETGLERTAIKSAVKGIKAIEPAILKFERPAKGKKLVTNGRPLGATGLHCSAPVDISRSNQGMVRLSWASSSGRSRRTCSLRLFAA